MHEMHETHEMDMLDETRREVTYVTDLKDVTFLENVDDRVEQIDRNDRLEETDVRDLKKHTQENGFCKIIKIMKVTVVPIKIMLFMRVMLFIIDIKLKLIDSVSITNPITTSLFLSSPSIKMTFCQTGMEHFLLCSLLSNILQKCSPNSHRVRAKRILPFREKKHSFVDNLLFIIPMPNDKLLVSFYWKNNGNVYKNLFANEGLTSKMLLKLAGDVESNPGPGITLVTQNSRGLKKESKLRQLINRIYKTHKLTNSLIISLQETHVEHSNLNYLWKGSHIFTPGNGHQGGCITLLSENIEVVNQIDIDQEAHVAKLNVVENMFLNTIIIANIHAPCPHNQIKINFFQKIRESIDQLQSSEPVNCPVIILGDYNLTFNKKERINTIFTKKEKQIGDEINDIFDDLQLIDCWEYGKNDMT